MKPRWFLLAGVLLIGAAAGIKEGLAEGVLATGILLVAAAVWIALLDL